MGGPATSRAGRRRDHLRDLCERLVAAKSREISENRRKDLEWRLTKHIVPFFGPYPLCDIDKKLVKEFREFKLAERDRLAERIAAGERPVDERIVFSSAC